MTSVRPVLVIEDDDAFVRILEMFNRRWKLPLEFQSRPAGIRAAAGARDRYGLVLSDLRIPGLEVMKELAAFRTREPGVPIVLMSSLGIDEIPPEAQAIHPEAIYSKEAIIREGDRFAAELSRFLAADRDALHS